MSAATQRRRRYSSSERADIASQRLKLRPLQVEPVFYPSVQRAHPTLYMVVGSRAASLLYKHRLDRDVSSRCPLRGRRPLHKVLWMVSDPGR